MAGRTRGNTRGQTLVLFALTMLLLVLMVAMTIGMGVRARQKLELQTVAETAAYSNAVATARAYNTASLLNRTMVSEWVAMAGIHGLVAWVSEVKSIYGSFAGNAREMEAGNPSALSSSTCKGADTNTLGKPHWYSCPEYYDPPGPGACTNGTWSIRDASYEWWHAQLALWNPRGSPMGGDNVNKGCKMGVCSSYRPWTRIGWGELDARTGKQAKQIHESIAGLAVIQKHTFRELEDVLDGGRITKQLLNLSQGAKLDGKIPREFKIKGDVKKEQLAWREARHAADFKDDTHDRVMAEAVMGTRGKEFLVWHRELPKRVRRDLAEVQSMLDANWPGVWRFTVSPAYLSAYPTGSGSAFPMVPWRDDVVKDLGWASMIGDAKSFPVDSRGHGYQVTVRYRPPAGCGGGVKTLRSGTHAYLLSNSRGMSHHEWGHGMEMSSHARWPMKRAPGDTLYRDGDTITTCHPFHVHYDERDDMDVHEWEPYRGKIGRGGELPGLGFVFPRSRSDRGAGGAWGQPNLPVMLTWSKDPKKPDPWELDFRFRFSRSGPGERIDLGERDKLEDMVALGSAMAYYHRRGAWGEAPNLLNPFWRATLVPLGVDSRREDPTPGRPRESNIPDMLRASKFRQAASAFDELENQFEGLK